MYVRQLKHIKNMFVKINSYQKPVGTVQKTSYFYFTIHKHVSIKDRYIILVKKGAVILFRLIKNPFVY